MEVIHWIWIKKLWKTKFTSWIYLFSAWIRQKSKTQPVRKLFLSFVFPPSFRASERYLIKLISSMCAKKKFHGFSSEKFCVVIKSIHIFCDIFAVTCEARVKCKKMRCLGKEGYTHRAKWSYEKELFLFLLFLPFNNTFPSLVSCFYLRYSHETWNRVVERNTVVIVINLCTI